MQADVSKMSGLELFEKFISEIMRIVAIILITGIAQGLAISSLWNWFVAERFSIESLTVVNGYGIGLLFAVLTADYLRGTDKQQTKKWPLAAVIPLWLLLVGWIVKEFLLV